MTCVKNWGGGVKEYTSKYGGGGGGLGMTSSTPLVPLPVPMNEVTTEVKNKTKKPFGTQ